VSRTLPPTPRRLALAALAGQVPRSRALLAGAALLGAALALLVAGARAGGVLAAHLRDGLGHAGDHTPALAPASTAAQLGLGVLAVAVPVLAAAALAALVAHLGQVRRLWMPRRHIDGAPAAQAVAPRRLVDGALAVLALAGLGLVTLAWLARHRADLAALGAIAPAAAARGTLALVVSALAHLAAALVVVGAVELLLAVLRHRADLHLTRAEADADARAAGLDPRWRRSVRTGRAGDQRLLRLARRADLVVVGHGAVAVATPGAGAGADGPRLLGVARGAEVTTLVAAARRHRVPLPRDPALVTALLDAPTGPIDPRLWPAVAALVAASREPPAAAS
jgi:flagellar biosynthesis protein FlhB